jgi:hypothetical protein
VPRDDRIANEGSNVKREPGTIPVGTDSQAATTAGAAYVVDPDRLSEDADRLLVLVKQQHAY